MPEVAKAYVQLRDFEKIMEAHFETIQTLAEELVHLRERRMEAHKELLFRTTPAGEGERSTFSRGRRPRLWIDRNRWSPIRLIRNLFYRTWAAREGTSRR